MRCLSQLAREMGVDKAQISRDFKHIRKLWRENYLQDWNAAQQEELARIAVIEQKAWLAWERSCKDEETLEVTGSSQGGTSQPQKVKKITKRQTGDARYLAILLKCAEQRRVLLGLEASLKGDRGAREQPLGANSSSPPFKVYMGFDPRVVLEPTPSRVPNLDPSALSAFNADENPGRAATGHRPSAQEPQDGEKPTSP
jgi:hypothetical protein